MTLLATNWLALMLIAGAGLVFAGYLGYRDAIRRPNPSEEHPERYAEGLTVDSNGVPAVLIALYTGMALAMIGYVLFVWLARPSI